MADNKKKKKVKKVTSKDVPGIGKKGGMARKAAETIEKRNKLLKSI